MGMASLCTTLASAQTTFTDEALARGLRYVVVEGAFGGPGQYGCGVALCDLDADGDEDMVCSGGQKSTLALFENDGTGHFVDRTATCGLGSPSKPSGIAAGDYDADGDLDLCITRWYAPLLLFRNDGGLQFTDVTAAAGVALPGIAAGGGAAWGDYDGDGWIDLSIANRTGGGTTIKNRLFRNLGNGTFVDVAPSLGINSGFASFHAGWCDLDRDGDLDLYVSNDKGTAGLSWNHLYRNNGDGTFYDDAASNALISLDAMGVCFGDVSGDSRPDIYVANVPTGNVLLQAAAFNTYANVTSQAGVGAFATCWGGICFDPDHDGDTDLFVAATAPRYNFMFENTGTWPMVNQTASWGLGDPGESYCHASGDVDGDGDVDLLVQARDANLRLYINQSPQRERHWVTFRPIGIGTDRNALGLQIDVDNGNGLQWRQVESGSAYKSQSSLILHVGAGTARTLASVVVRWPNGGGSRTLFNYGVDCRWTLWPDARLGDSAGDGVLGLDDRAAFLACKDAAFAPGCEQHDFDGDADVDDADELLFLRRYCDLTGDWKITHADLGHLLGAWGEAAGGPSAGDFDGDGVVDGADLALLLQCWDV
ncbi:MAG: FG-GAP-like repeat-containing protein [Phycisphaerae bacterium]|nr:FG-GAP-like repeat-containing protein [Phycisphaerae bacterium]